MAGRAAAGLANPAGTVFLKQSRDPRQPGAPDEPDPLRRRRPDRCRSLPPPPPRPRPSAAEREAFRAEVRAYLLENPEVLMEAFTALEQRQQAGKINADLARLDEHFEAIFADPASWVGGNPDGDITVVEFIDYRCGFIAARPMPRSRSW
ncbi:MAG: hypothetical protein MZV49_25090 [Rhodopseudomonas palustris]|nr:hypothetical protein [Rhodopseudomonas palustris]